MKFYCQPFHSYNFAFKEKLYLLFQIPNDAFPTYSHPDALISLSYHVSIILNECAPIEIPVIIGTGISIRSVNTRNDQPSMRSLLGYTKIPPFSSSLHQETFPPLSKSSKLLPLLRFHLLPVPFPPPLQPIPPPYFDSNLHKYPTKPHISPLYTPFSHFHPNRNCRSQATSEEPEKLPETGTRYKGQSVLRIEEIE